MIVAVRIVLIVSTPGDAHRALAEAVRHHDPDAELVGVWAGDPHLRPRLSSTLRWIDQRVIEPSGVGWPLLLVALPPVAYAWTRAAAALADHPSTRPTVVLRHGDVAVLRSLDGLVDRASGAIAVGYRTPAILPSDGLAPGTSDLARAGRLSTAMLFVPPQTTTPFGLLADAMRSCFDNATVGQAFAEWAERVGAVGLANEVMHAVGWAAFTGRPALLDVVALDTNDCVAAFGRNPRILLSSMPELRATIDQHRSQWTIPTGPRHPPLALPGGITVDRPIRALVGAAIERWQRGSGELPPEPFGPTNGDFVAWLETPWPPWEADIGRYWNELRRQRTDLCVAFPHPEGSDHAAFAAWAEGSWRYEPRSSLLRTSSAVLRPPWHSVARAPGVNVVGYLGFDKSLGDVARRALRALEAAGEPCAALDYYRSGSPRSAETPMCTDEVRHDINLVVINADQFPLLAADHGPELLRGRRTIAYWFWELSYVPESMIASMRFVDEIWVASEFTADAFRAVSAVPVRVVPLTVPAPVVSAATPEDLGVASTGFTFLVSLDHLSVTARKNPIDAVRAFRRAFPEQVVGGPTLIVKTINASHRWAEHEQILLAGGDRADIVVVDRHLCRDDQMALVAHSSCMVSLHRAEGLGLHLMEAMWLGVPCIATRYSGNVDFMNDDNSLLIDATLIPVRDGEGYFPEVAVWAQPDISEAARSMRAVFDDASLRARLTTAALASMQAQPTLAGNGAQLRTHVQALRQRTNRN